MGKSICYFAQLPSKIPIVLRFLLGLILTGLAVTQGMAQIVESKDSLIGRDERSLLRVLQQQTKASSDKPSSGNAIIAAQMGGAFLKVTVIGAQTTDVQLLATALETAAPLGTRTQTFIEDGLSVAQFETTQGSYFQMASREKVDLDSIRKQLRKGGLQVRTILRVPTHATASPRIEPIHTTGSWKYVYFNPTSAIPPITVESTLSYAALLFIVPFVLNLPILLLLGLKGDLITRIVNQALGRSTPYGLLSNYSLFIVLALIQLPFILSNLPMRIADLWQGSSSEWTGGGLRLLSLLPLLLVFPLLGRYEKKIRAQFPLEAIKPGVKHVISDDSRFKKLEWGLLLGGTAIFFLSRTTPGTERPRWAELALCIGFAGFFFAKQIWPWFEWKLHERSRLQIGVLDSEESARNELNAGDRIRHVFASLKLPIHEYTIIEGLMLSPILRGGGLTVSTRFVKELSVHQIEFALIYSIYRKQLENMGSWVTTIGFLGLGSTLVFAIDGGTIYPLLVVTTLALIYLRFLPKIMPWALGLTVSQALRAYPFPDAAESYFKLVQPELSPNAKPAWLFLDPWRAYQTGPFAKESER